jgi:hypothetical protein
MPCETAQANGEENRWDAHQHRIALLIFFGIYIKIVTVIDDKYVS